MTIKDLKKSSNELKEVYNDLNKIINKIYKICVDTDDDLFLKSNILISKVLEAKFFLADKILSSENDEHDNLSSENDEHNNNLEMNKETDLIPLEKLIERFESKILVDAISGVNYQDELIADKSVVYYLKIILRNYLKN